MDLDSPSSTKGKNPTAKLKNYEFLDKGQSKQASEQAVATWKQMVKHHVPYKELAVLGLIEYASRYHGQRTFLEEPSTVAEEPAFSSLNQFDRPSTAG
ncbi:hypothetical protein FFRU_150090 [Fructobacillus fructosus]|nr:hypothetical protein FFRU_150090 [Fructobacillus fructosus]